MINSEVLLNPLTLVFVFLGLIGFLLNYILHRKLKNPRERDDAVMGFFILYAGAGMAHLMVSVFPFMGTQGSELTLHLELAYTFSGFWLGSYLGIIVSMAREWSIKKGEVNRKLKQELVQIERKVLQVTKNRGGIVTEIILLDELGIPFDEGAEILNRWVRRKVARRLDFGVMKVYDVPSARVHLSKTDKSIMDTIIGMQGRAKKTVLFSVLQLSIEVLEEALKRLEKFGYLTYDRISDEYGLRGIT